jgi:hypothetical protein
MQMPVPYKEICEVPDALIGDMLSTIEEDHWGLDDYRKCIDALRSTSSIPIRHTALCGVLRDDDSVIQDINDRPLFQKYEPVLTPMLALLRTHYVFNEYAAFIARLNPKSSIGMHSDGGNFLTKCHRIHFPLQTNPQVAYCIEDQEYYWQRGRAYEFDNTRVHGVKNRSDEARIHLVVNLYNLDGLP